MSIKYLFNIFKIVAAVVVNCFKHQRKAQYFHIFTCPSCIFFPFKLLNGIFNIVIEKKLGVQK